MNMFAFYTAKGVVTSVTKTKQPLSFYKDHERSGIEVGGSMPSSPNHLYVDTSLTPHTLKEKTEFTFNISKTTLLADGVDEVVISNIPNGTFVTWPDGQVDEVTDGVVEFSTTQPDTYVLKFEHPHYLKKEVSLEAHV